MIKDDFIGQRFERLTVIERDYSKKSKNSYYICKCDCGNITSASRSNLRNGSVKSCGCYNKDRTTKYGWSKTRIGGIYRCMVRRCENPNDASYPDYGGRGIKVCKEWLEDPNSFRNWALENGYADNLTIDRIDVNGNYEPNNCRWADRITQSNNTRYNNHVIYEGVLYTVSELARVLGVSRNTIYRYFKTEKDIKKDSLFLTGCGNSYVPKKCM